MRSEIANISDRYVRCLSGRSLDKRQESGVCRYIWVRNRWWSKTGNSAVPAQPGQIAALRN